MIPYSPFAALYVCVVEVVRRFSVVVPAVPKNFCLKKDLSSLGSEPKDIYSNGILFKM